MILNPSASFLLLTLVSSIAGEFVCPEEDDQEFRCLCLIQDYSLVACDFQYGSQQQIDLAFPALRRVNNVSSGEYLTFDSVLLSSTGSHHTTFNMTPLALTNLTSLSLSLNSEFTGIVGGTNSTDDVDIDPFRFSTRSFEVTGSSIGDSSVQEILKFLDPERLEILSMYTNKFESVPDLTPFKNLVEVDLSRNNIGKVGSGNFRGLGNLLNLILHENNINELEEGAFLFEPLEREEGTKDLWTKFGIGLNGNNLTDEKIHVNHGLDSAGRETWVSFGENKFEFISQEKFEKILLAHPLNLVFFVDNPFVCDCRSFWLKEKREEYENRVLGLVCTNDPQNTIFTTDLLSSCK